MHSSLRSVIILTFLLSTAHTEGNEDIVLTSVVELQTLFQKFYQETLAEFKEIKTSMETLSADVGKLRQDFDAAQSTVDPTLRKLGEDVVQNREDLKALNEFGLNQAGFHFKPSQGYLYSGARESGSITTYNMRNPAIYSKCQNLYGPVRSVNTQKGCLRLYNKPNCRGLNMMAVPGLYNHEEIQMTVRSVGPCTFDTKHL